MRRLLTCLPVIFLLMPFTASAQQAPALEMPDSADVRIIVDISGSMKTNDPDNLRRPAVRLLARMLPAGASAGVWTFGQYVNMLVPHGEVRDDWRGLAITRSDEINSVALRTNLGEAIRVASDPYLLGTEDLSNTDFILLTDGKVDISADASANEQERERIRGPLLEELSARGATIHTVALSRDADLGLLETLADKTGGSYSLAASADALTLAFLEALNTAVPQQQIPIEGNGFTVDDGVEEFTALIFRAGDESPADRELALVTPGGTEATPESVIDGMRWVRETEYDLITVTEPEAGEWKINGELGEGSRVTVVSDLRMVVSPVPPTFTEGEPISLQVAFFEEDQKIENPDFLGVIDVSVTLTSDDGRSGSKTLSTDQPPEDGVYTDTITRLPDAGEYQLSVVADGQTFSRRFSTATRYVLPEGLAAPTDPVNEAEEIIQEEPAPEEAEPPGAEPGPIDISQAEEPQPEPEPEPAEEQPVNDTAVEQEGSPASESDDASAIPVWMMAAGGALGLIIIAGAVFLVMRRKKSEPEQEEQDEEPPLVAEEAADEEDIPVAEPEPEEPLEPEPEEQPEPESQEEIRKDEGEDQKEELPDDEIPVADAEVDEGDDEFGLEDFDLSEFDDLPDTENEEEPRDDDKKDR